MVAMSIERLKKVPENHGKDDTSVRYRWKKDDKSVVYSCSNRRQPCHAVYYYFYKITKRI